LFSVTQEGRYKATWKKEFKIPWREAGPPDHLDDKVKSDQEVVNKELFLFGRQKVEAAWSMKTRLQVWESALPGEVSTVTQVNRVPLLL